MPESSGSPRASRKWVGVAYRGWSALPSSSRAVLERSGPDRRTIPIAPRPGPVAIATMTSGFATRGLGPLQRPRDVPLLGNRKDIVDQPVQDQPRRKEEEEHAEGNWHDLHELGLHRIGWCRIKPCLDEHRRAHQYRQYVIWILPREIVNPQSERRLAQLDAQQQHPIQCNEDRDLDHDGQAAAERIDLLGLVQLHHGLMHLLPIIAI